MKALVSIPSVGKREEEGEEDELKEKRGEDLKELVQENSELEAADSGSGLTCSTSPACDTRRVTEVTESEGQLRMDVPWQTPAA